MIESSTVTFKMKRGGTFNPSFTFYADEAQTQPLPLDTYTVAVVLDLPSPVTLTVGSGLVVTGGQLAIHWDTPTTVQELVHYFIEWTDPIGDKDFPIVGTIVFSDP